MRRQYLDLGVGSRLVVLHGQPAPERLDLRLQLSDHLLVRVLVAADRVLDALGSVGVLERGHGLLDVVVGGRDGGEHERGGVTSERLLQQSGEFGISIGNDLLGTLLGALG